jgi:transposase InsO family protein
VDQSRPSHQSGSDYGGQFFESIVYRYGVPNSIITDNGTNFAAGEFQQFAKELGIKIKYASVAHPKSNGQVKKANGLVCGGLDTSQTYL